MSEAEIVWPLAFITVVLVIVLFGLRSCRKMLEEAIWHHRQAQDIYAALKETPHGE